MPESQAYGDPWSLWNEWGKRDEVMEYGDILHMVGKEKLLFLIYIR
jgi:hypothetical protein